MAGGELAEQDPRGSWRLHSEKVAPSPQGQHVAALKVDVGAAR